MASATKEEKEKFFTREHKYWFRTVNVADTGEVYKFLHSGHYGYLLNALYTKSEEEKLGITSRISTILAKYGVSIASHTNNLYTKDSPEAEEKLLDCIVELGVIYREIYKNE